MVLKNEPGHPLIAENVSTTPRKNYTNRAKVTLRNSKFTINYLKITVIPKNNNAIF